MYTVHKLYSVPQPDPPPPPPSLLNRIIDTFSAPKYRENVKHKQTYLSINSNTARLITTCRFLGTSTLENGMPAVSYGKGCNSS